MSIQNLGHWKRWNENQRGKSVEDPQRAPIVFVADVKNLSELPLTTDQICDAVFELAAQIEYERKLQDSQESATQTLSAGSASD